MTNCTVLRTLKTQTQPRMNQINMKIERTTVDIMFKHRPQVAAIFNAVESEMKHMNVLKGRSNVN